MSAELARLDPLGIHSCNADRYLLRRQGEWVCYLISIDDDETATYLTWQGVCQVNVPASTAKNGVENYLREGWYLVPTSGKEEP